MYIGKKIEKNSSSRGWREKASEKEKCKNKNFGSTLLYKEDKMKGLKAIWLLCILFSGVSGEIFAQEKFPIANTKSDEICLEGAFDGTNFLVGIVEGTEDSAILKAQMFSQNGSLVGGKITIGAISSEGPTFCAIAFDGTNYLVVWQNGNALKGRFITKSGSFVGSEISISSGIESIGHIGFGGGKYLVVYNKEGVDGKSVVFGKIITKSGSVGTEFRISTGCGKEHGGIGNLAFDGTNFIVVWTEDVGDSEIRGAFVNPDAGVINTNFSINASLSPSDNPCAVAFDGTNYLIIWPDEIGGETSEEWVIFGQFFDKSGNPKSGVISISEVSSPDNIIAPSATFDGTNYLITWNRYNNNTTGWDIIGRIVGKDGNLLSSEIAIYNEIGHQFGGVLGFVNGKYLALINDNLNFTLDEEEEDMILSGGDVYGMFKSIVLDTTGTKGDMNNDGIVDITDVILVLRKAIGLD